MAISLPFSVSFLFLILSFFISQANATEGLFSVSASTSAFASDTTLPPSPSSPPPMTSNSNSNSNSNPNDLHENTLFSHTAILGPILSHLGFTELSLAAPSLSSDSTTTAWSGPSTLFAPSDSSLHSCLSCSVPHILREHIVPGLYTIDYLRNLAFGTKIETLSPGRCLTVTSTSIKNVTSTSTSTSTYIAAKVFVGGVEITHPDLFNNGLIVIHGIQGYVVPLSPYSCDVERLNSLTFPFNQQDRVISRHINHQFLPHPAIMRLMMRDAMVRLRNNGFSILSLAMRAKYVELVTLNNMTMFALDDASIFSGSQSYISHIRFHIVPNVYLTHADLEKLPVGTRLPTLERGHSLVVTGAGGGNPAVSPMRINYVRVKIPDVIRNMNIVVHSVYLPFPRIDPAVAAFDGIMGEQAEGGNHAPVEGGACTELMDYNGSCDGAPMPQGKPFVDMDDNYGL
ncbi:fasciclin-like arabinogalactan protein 21 [Euphorbia lathyris]|uniref:fasciclin-like arabinogalactan protein 21 n=1 Tax=Euphorbia lathyris TaxID=212925 RepID=UPI003313CB4D